MPPRLPPLRTPPIGFAHRGARAHERENTLPAFVLARRLGATGLESDVWLSADGVAVLDHDGTVGRFGRKPIGEVARTALPDHIPSLADLYDTCGAEYELSLDIKTPAAFPAVVEVARRYGALERLWVCHPDRDLLVRWRAEAPDVKLVASTRVKALREGPERFAAQLAASGIDAVNLPIADWTGGLVALFHRFERLAFAWDTHFDRHLHEALDMGADAIYSDHVDRMTSALARFYPDA